MLKRRSLFERCVTLSVGTWSVARKHVQSIRSVDSHMRNLTTSYFEWKETKFVDNKTAIYRQNRSSLCLLFVKLALLCVFFFIYPTYHIRKSKPGACLRRKQSRQAPATTETAVRRYERLTKEPIATNPSIAKDSWATCGYGTLNCAILSKYELLRASARRQFASARRQIGTGLFFRSNHCRFRSKFAWALPLNLSSLWIIFFFSETTNTDKKWNLVPNARLPW